MDGHSILNKPELDSLEFFLGGHGGEWIFCITLLLSDNIDSLFSSFIWNILFIDTYCVVCIQNPLIFEC